MYAMLAPRWNKLLCLALLLLQTATAQDTCLLAVDIAPGESTWTMNATVQAGTLSPGLKVLTNEFGWMGRAFLHLPSSTCPGTVASLSALLDGATFVSPVATEVVNVRVWPSRIATEINTGPVVLAAFDLLSIELSLSGGAWAPSESLTGLAYTVRPTSCSQMPRSAAHRCPAAHAMAALARPVHLCMGFVHCATK